MLMQLTSLFQIAAFTFWVCCLSTWVISFYHFRKFYKAWRLKKIELNGYPSSIVDRVELEARLSVENIFSLFSSDLSNEARHHRKWLLIATIGFVMSCAFGIVFMYLGFHRAH